MIVLGFDTATSATAVALRLADGSVAEARDDPSPGAHPGHATRLLGMAGELLAQAGVGWEQLQRIAVGVGPGTFTGLRVGVASARGLAQSLDAELIGVSSTMALACGALGEGEGKVLACVDARRGEVFAALYEQGPRELRAPCALAPERVAVLVEGEAGVVLVGDGALRYREQLLADGLSVAEQGSQLHLLRASAVCELACAAGAEAGGYQRVVPDYRRRPDAELKLQAAAGGGS